MAGKLRRDHLSKGVPTCKEECRKLQYEAAPLEDWMLEYCIIEGECGRRRQRPVITPVTKIISYPKMIR